MQPTNHRLRFTCFCTALVCLGLVPARLLAIEVFAITPVHDAFVRASQPGLNYGAAGALAVAGADAVNGSGQPQGRFDTMIQFDAAPMVGAFETAYGPGNWQITSAKLRVVEVGAPNNPMFNRGSGQFEILWFSEDDWVEGPGKPNAPPVGQGNEMTYALLQFLLSSATESSLGIFVNAGADVSLEYDLALAPALLGDLLVGDRISLHLIPITDTIGFTLNSKDNTTVSVRPQLIVTAIPEPTVAWVTTVGILFFWRRTRSRLGGI